MLTEACRRPAATGPARRRAGVQAEADRGPRPHSGVAPVAVTAVGALAVLTVSAALALSGAGMLGVAVPAARVPFGGGGPLLAAAYAIPLALVTLVSGHLADRAGAARLLRIGLLALAGSSLLCSLAWNLPSLVALRVLQGAAAGVLPATALALLLRTAPRRRLGEALGVFAAGALLLPAAAPLLGAALAGQLGWRPLLAAEGAVALLAARASMALLPRSAAGDPGRLDLAGLASGVAGLLLALLALGGGPWWGWGSPLTVLLGLGGAAALAGFVLVELSADRPLLDLRGLCDPAAGAGSLILAVLVTCLGAGFLEAPSLLHQAQGAGPLGAWSPLLGGLAAAAALPLSGRLCDRAGPRWPAAVGLSLLADATYLLQLTGPGTAGWEVAALIALRGTGMGMALAPVLTMVLAGIAAGAENRAAAAVAMVLRLPAASGLAVLAGVTAAARPLAVPGLDLASLPVLVAWAPVRALLLVTAGVGSLGVLLALRLPTAPGDASRVDLAGLLAALTGSRRRELTLTGVDAPRPEPPAAAPTPRPRRPRPPAEASAAAPAAAARTRTSRSATAAPRAAKSPAAPATRTAARPRRTGATAVEVPTPPAAPKPPAVPRARQAAPAPSRRRPAAAREPAATAPATPARRTPARSPAAPARRRKAENGPAA
ncbi:MAG TPA: MFS transporter [Candidatus Dormibacteraeota bacterium]|nr:MFS transporter [Candidatus Dormibacteraeota bacterium]